MSYQKHAGTVRRFTKAMKFGAWIQGLPNKLTPPPFRLMQIGSAFWQSRALYTAAQMDIASVLGEDEQDARQLALELKTNPEAIARLMRFLAAMGIFEEVSPKTYRNNKLSSYLRTDNPENVRAMILMHNSEPMSRPWYEHLENGVRKGAPPFQLAHGEQLFSYLDHHAEMDTLFSDAMNTVEALSGDSYATDFDWGRFQRIFDLGGSRGAKSLTIINKHPHLTARVIDRAPAIAEALEHWSKHQQYSLKQLSFEAGDLLTLIPPARDEHDIYLLSAVLHGFDDEACTTILRNLADAIGHTGARCAVIEMVLPEMNADLAGAAFDMQMFMGTQGRERTLAEWKSLIDRASLKLEEVVGLRSFGSILVLCQ